MEIELILFDADNTLVDYNKAEKQALKNALKISSIKFKNQYLEYYKDINQEIWIDYELGKISSEKLRVERFRRLFEKINIQNSPSDFSNIYLSQLMETKTLMLNAKKVLKQLYPKYKIGILTNGIKKVQEKRLRNAGIDKYIHAWLCSEEAGIQKPDKKIFEMLMHQMNCRYKEKAIIIGDSLSSDIQGGINTGIKTCWFNPANEINKTEIIPDIEINNLIELLELFN